MSDEALWEQARAMAHGWELAAQRIHQAVMRNAGFVEEYSCSDTQILATAIEIR